MSELLENYGDLSKNKPAPNYIFFRKLSKDVLGIVDVLHENMDIPNRLKEDLDK